MVATDIAARGIHVDDVALVIHADPPAEHKAYLHRSGRTARAGAAGTVVTLMTDDQVSDVRDLTRRAGIAARTTRLRPGHPLLTELAPGQRSFVAPPAVGSTTPEPAPGQRSRRTPTASSGSSRTRRPRRAAALRSGAGEGSQATSEVQPRVSGAAAFSSRTRVGSRRGR
jgi:superfamily II DNA/RNA helicase